MPILSTARGLITQPSEITRPDGALSVADNVVVDYSNIIQQRRGLFDYSNQLPGSVLAKQLLTYKNVVLAHYAEVLAYDNGFGTFVEFNAVVTELVHGLRIKYLEANGNLYFTTNTGVKKISALSVDQFSPTLPVTDAGGIEAIDLSVDLVTDAAGYLPAQSKSAYRLVYGTKDANSNLILGAPSARVVLTNTSADVNQSEVFTINILNYAGITASQYFTFDTPSQGYFVWYDLTGSDPAPATADTLNRQGVPVDITGLTTNAQVAAQTATVMAATISEIAVSLGTTEVTVTMNAPGDVGDASQGSLSSSNVLITKLFDGSISPGVAANGLLTFTLPEQITTDYFYQIYRTGIATVTAGLTLNDIDPGDEMNFVYEAPITAIDITNMVISYLDSTPDSFRAAGALLYTNPISGEGIAQANTAPPLAQDLALFRNSVFYANTKDIHRLQFSMLSVDDYVSGVTNLTIGRDGTAVTYTFVGVEEQTTIDVLAQSQTVGNSYFTLNAANDARLYYVWFDKGILSYSFNSTTAVNAGTDTITITNHGYATNDPVVLSGTVPGGLVAGTTYYVIRTGANTFQLSATVGGGAINISTAVGTATITYTPADPAVANRIGIRVPLVLYPDTTQGSVDALTDAMSFFSDFVATEVDSNTVLVSCSDTGSVSPPTQSTPPSGWTITVTQTGDGEDDVAREVLLSMSTSPAIAIDLTARSLIRVINRDVDSPVVAKYLSGTDDLPGKILLQAKDLVDTPFYIAINDDPALPSQFTPELAVNVILNSINSATDVFTSLNPHGFAIGDRVYLNDNPGGTPTEFGGTFTVATVPTATTFTLQGVDVGINQPGPLSGALFKATTASDNNVNPNRLYYSKTGQPEAVPLVNFIDIGPKNKQIYRILALRDNLFVLKQDGVYIITGNSAPDFSVRLLDNSACLIAPDTAVVLNNLIYMLSGQGVVTVSETGVSIISRNIEDLISKVTTSDYDYVHPSFGVSYETDRAYLMWLPTRKSDTVATQCFRYNTLTSAWTRWTRTETCGVVNFGGTNKLHLGSGIRPYIEQERKNGDRTDYADRELPRSLGASAIKETLLTLSSVAEVTVGDTIVQNQCLSIASFNRLLKMLDSDPGTSIKTYYVDNAVAAGADLANSLQALITQLNTDPNLAGTFTPSSDVNTLIALRDDFNVMIDELNDPASGTIFKNYRKVEDLIYYEVLIVEVLKNTNQVIVNAQSAFIEGDISVFQGIVSVVQYAPQHFGSPQLLKQVSEGTLIFDQDTIYGGTISYSSDRSADFVDIPFTMSGPGYWGGFNWGDIVWGGDSNEIPLRTLIPQNKSRCRYLHVKFTHVNAREQYKLLGISLEPREVSTRAYR